MKRRRRAAAVAALTLAIAAATVATVRSQTRVPRGPGLRAPTQARPTIIGFYVGRQDSCFLDDHVDFDAR